MAFEELNIGNDEWEVFHNSEGMLVPIMDEYPSPENTFDVWSGVDDGDTAPPPAPTTPAPRQGVDPELLAGALTTAVSVGSQLYANRDTSKRELKNVCGSKPFCIGKKRCRDKKDKYEACKKEFYMGSGGFKSGGTQQQTMPVYTPPPPPRGMSTTAKVGIALGIVALGVGGYFLYKRSKG